MTNGVAVRRAVVCEDDETMRGVIARLLDDLGLDVVGETSDADEAITLVTESGADLVVLDLALRRSSGEEVLAQLVARAQRPQVVVFSSFVDSADALQALGASAVVEKPDFLALEETINALLTAASDDERRRPQRPPATLRAPHARTGGGFETWKSFCSAARDLEPGDSLVVLDLLPGEDDREIWDHVHRMDHLVALGRIAALVGRPAERVTLSPGGLPVIAVVGGHREAPAAVFARIQQDWKNGSPAGVPVGACGYVSDDWPPLELLELLVEAGSDGADPEKPLRVV